MSFLKLNINIKKFPMKNIKTLIWIRITIRKKLSNGVWGGFLMVKIRSPPLHEF